MTPDGEGRLVFGRFDWPTDLTVGRLYQVLSDEHGLYRVVDDTGEDYMYPIWMFEHAFQQSLP